MDGTIVNTEHLWKQASYTLIAKRGYTLSPQEDRILCQQLPGSGLRNSCKLIKAMIKTEDSIEILMQEKQAIACQLYSTGIRFIDGFPQFHKQAIKYNLKTAIATNANEKAVEWTNKSLNLSTYFGPHIYTINQVNNIGKPQPAIYLYAAAQLQVDPTECIAIEDSAHGIMAAQAAGMFCIGINSSGKPKQIEKADLRINGYDQIILQTLLFG